MCRHTLANARRAKQHFAKLVRQLGSSLYFDRFLSGGFRELPYPQHAFTIYPFTVTHEDFQIGSRVVPTTSRSFAFRANSFPTC